VVVLLVISFVLNVVALCLPFVVVDAAGSSPWIYGLFGSVRMLWEADMYGLSAMVFCFSVVFPFTKLVVLGWLWWSGVHNEQRHGVLAWIEKLGKWSLFDVFLIAIMVALTNDQWLISSASLPGLTCFLIAVVLGMLAGELLTAASDPVPPASPADPPRSLPVLILVLITGGLLIATSVVPFIEIDDWRLDDRPYSLVALVAALWQNGSPVLSLSLATFVIAVPIVSWLLILWSTIGWWNRVPPERLRGLNELVSRWSMMSVFAISLAVFLAEGHRFLGTRPLVGVWTLVIGLGLAWFGQFLARRSWR
jgi:paraquat-inducible protein A